MFSTFSLRTPTESLFVIYCHVQLRDISSTEAPSPSVITSDLTFLGKWAGTKFRNWFSQESTRRETPPSVSSKPKASRTISSPASAFITIATNESGVETQFLTWSPKSTDLSFSSSLEATGCTILLVHSMFHFLGCSRLQENLPLQWGTMIGCNLRESLTSF